MDTGSWTTNSFCEKLIHFFFFSCNFKLPSFNFLFSNDIWIWVTYHTNKMGKENKVLQQKLLVPISHIQTQTSNLFVKCCGKLISITLLLLFVPDTCFICILGFFLASSSAKALEIILVANTSLNTLKWS